MMENQKILRRQWVIQNYKWFEEEMVFYRSCSSHFKLPKQELWKLDSDKGTTSIK